MTTVAIGFLLVAGAAFAYRILRGPSLADRAIGIDGMLIVGVCAIAVHAVDSGIGAFLPVAVVFTLVSFISSAVIARFIEGQGK